MFQPRMKTLMDGYGPFTTAHLVIKKKLSTEVLITRRGVLPNHVRQVQWII